MKINKNNKLLIILSTIVVFLVIGQIFLSNGYMEEGLRVKEIEDKIEKTENENQILKNKIALQTRLSDLEEYAKSQGFVKDPPIVNLSTKVPVAALNK